MTDAVQVDLESNNKNPTHRLIWEDVPHQPAEVLAEAQVAYKRTGQLRIAHRMAQQTVYGIFDGSELLMVFDVFEQTPRSEIVARINHPDAEDGDDGRWCFEKIEIPPAVEQSNLKIWEVDGEDWIVAKSENARSRTFREYHCTSTRGHSFRLMPAGEILNITDGDRHWNTTARQYAEQFGPGYYPAYN